MDPVKMQQFGRMHPGMMHPLGGVGMHGLI
jgi:hypothetical protein